MNGRLVLASLFVVGGVLIAFAGASPQAALTPSEALQADSGSVSVKGTVASVDEANRTFTLTDGDQELRVEMVSALPSAVAQGQGLVAKGELVSQDGERVLQASEILAGCPSKYEA